MGRTNDLKNDTLGDRTRRAVKSFQFFTHQGSRNFQKKRVLYYFARAHTHHFGANKSRLFAHGITHVRAIKISPSLGAAEKQKICNLSSLSRL